MLQLFMMMSAFAANQETVTYTWSMTAGTNGSYNGYSPASDLNVGSISAEPVAGQTIRRQLSGVSNASRFQFLGNATSAVSGFTELVVNGTSYAISSWTYNGTATYAVFTTTAPTYSNGVTYTCELR